MKKKGKKNDGLEPNRCSSIMNHYVIQKLNKQCDMDDCAH